MSQQLILFLKEEVVLVEEPETNKIFLRSQSYKIAFSSVKPGLKNVLRSLNNEGASFEKLHAWLEADDGILAVSKLDSYLQKFSQLGWLCYLVLAENDLIATAIPISREIQFINVQVSQESRYVLSRFSYLHQVDGQMTLESPLSKMQIRLFSWQGAAILSQLAQPCNYLELAAHIPNLSIDTARQLLSLLMNSQMLSETSVEGYTLELADTTLAQWEFHDLLFHTRSRVGRHLNPVGANYRFSGKIDPLPAIKPKMSVKKVVDLYKPDLESLKNKDVPFTQVLEARKSIRKHGENPITIQQLGEFLYRAARIKEIVQTQHEEIASGSYPSAGGLYELELYLAINQCENVDSGIYHYQSLEHQLCLLSEKTKILDTLVKNASHSLGTQDAPQVIIFISARFQRIAWKYQSIAYSLILENVGALYQTMYLVATAMNLAPCGIGKGNSDLFVKATGCEYYTETSVGEFALGSADILIN
jgi:oxazoline/thiazoline dehydrogenase